MREPRLWAMQRFGQDWPAPGPAWQRLLPWLAELKQPALNSHGHRAGRRRLEPRTGLNAALGSLRLSWARTGHASAEAVETRRQEQADLGENQPRRVA